jgi:aspartate 1-decarboxylase
MFRKLLRSKIHHPRVTACDPEYVGSITIDAELLRASDIAPNEAVVVADLETSARFETYVICGEAGSEVVGVNGAAANLVVPGDRLIVLAFAFMQSAELSDHHARVVVCDARNRVAERLSYATHIEAPEPAEL